MIFSLFLWHLLLLNWNRRKKNTINSMDLVNKLILHRTSTCLWILLKFGPALHFSSSYYEIDGECGKRGRAELEKGEWVREFNMKRVVEQSEYKEWEDFDSKVCFTVTQVQQQLQNIMRQRILEANFVSRLHSRRIMVPSLAALHWVTFRLGWRSKTHLGPCIIWLKNKLTMIRPS